MHGMVESLLRYPIKSLRGEQLAAGSIDARGLLGDRAFALVDVETGRIASAKQPKHWAALLQLAARAGADFDGVDPHAVQVTLADGRVLSAADPQLTSILSAWLGRDVVLVSEPPAGTVIERLTPDGEDDAGKVIDVPVATGAPAGTLFDFAPLHFITTASLRALEAVHPQQLPSRAPRFRPNLVLALDGVEGFAENDWGGRTLRVGEVELRVICATPRCAVPTLQHGDDGPADPALVRTLREHNRVPIPGLGARSCLGAYAKVLTPGTVRTGDPVQLLP